MRLPEFARTTAFRWSLAVAFCFVALSLVLFAFLYWQTAVLERERLDAVVLHESRYIAAAPTGSAAARVHAWLEQDLHSVRFAALYDAAGRWISGNIPSPPPGLPVDGRAHDAVFPPIDQDGDAQNELVRATALRLDGEGGALLVVGHDTDQLERIEAVMLRALGLGLLPMFALSLGMGALLGRRAQRRIGAVNAAVGRVINGRLGERLPLRGSDDDFDRLAGGVNAMLAEIERLVEEVRGVGDSIAHDLRTPLTRARARLERTRDAARSPDEFREALDRSMVWIDQTLAVITAVLRVGEIEHGRRRAAFARVDLEPLVREVADLYDPIAEEKGVTLTVEVGAAPRVLGDRDLLFEAVGNVVDNALKFTPAGGRVRLALSSGGGGAVVRVVDTGPGIPREDRGKVLQRFYRGERSRSVEGSGLGLSLVAAVARLHGFGLRIGGEQGCDVELVCAATGEGRQEEDRSRTAEWR